MVLKDFQFGSSLIILIFSAMLREFYVLKNHKYSALSLQEEQRKN